MEHFKRILLATDFSDASAAAAEHAVLMAKTFKSELHILHVLEVEIPSMESGIDYLPLKYFEEFESHAADHLTRVIPAGEQKLLSLVPAVRKGGPFVEIIRYARTEKIDLIVMGTHGRGAWAHVMMGNVAEKVVRSAPCAVLTVRDPRHQFVMP